MALFETAIQYGIRADQPSAASVGAGTLYCVSDEGGTIERSNGSTWDSVGGGNSSRGYFEKFSRTYTYDQFVTTAPSGHPKGPLMTTLAPGDVLIVSTYRNLVAFDDSNLGSGSYVFPSDVDSYNYLGTDPLPVPGLGVVTTGDHNTVSLLNPLGPNNTTVIQQLGASYAFLEPQSDPLDIYAWIGGADLAEDGTQGTARLDLWLWRAPA